MIELTEENINNIKNDFPIKIGKCIQLFRKKLDLSQTKLAELTGKDRQYIYKIEKGKVTPNIVTIKIILTAMEITSSDFFIEMDKLD